MADPQYLTTTTEQKLPDWATPYSKKLLERALGVSEQPYSFWGSRVAGLAPEHDLGVQLATGRALYGAPDVNAARQNYLSTMRGDYLLPGSNPFLDATFDRAARAMTDQYLYGIAPSQTAMAVRNRAMGNTGFQEYMDQGRWQFGRNLEDLATNLYGGNYGQERQRQIAAMGMFPSFAQEDYNAAQQLYGAGDIRRQVLQQQLEQAYQEYQNARLQPYQNLQFLGEAIGGATSGQGAGTSTEPYFPPSAASGAIGGALTGYGLGNFLNVQNPWIPALAGGLLGFFM